MRTMMVDKYWYPPLNVVAHFERDFTSTIAPKKANELVAVAVAMAWMQELHRKPFLIQGVSDAEGSPDVRTLCSDDAQGDRAAWAHQQDVEVVTYTKHSSEKTLPEFVAATKLATDAAYDDMTTVLVDVQAGAPLMSQEAWHVALSTTGKRNPVLVLGKISDKPLVYRLASVYPVAEWAADFNPIALLKKQGYTKVSKLSLGTKVRETYDPDEKHCPFEKLGVTCKLI